MQANTEVDPAVAALESLTRVLVGIAWDSAHGARTDVTFPQMRLLLVLEKLGRVPCSRLAVVLGVNASSVTRLADKLEAHGYLARGEDEHKRSVVTVEVTPAGQRVVERVLDLRHAALRAVLDRMPAAQREAAATAAAHFVQAAAEVPTIDASKPGPL